MAYIDDRIWCHPKIVEVSTLAKWTWVCSVTYSSGMQTGGVLTPGQQAMIGSTPKVRSELVTAGLWDDVDGKTIRVHDWDDHNAARDERKRKDRERKREARRSGRWNGTQTSAGRPQDSPHAVCRTSAGDDADTTRKNVETSTARPRVEGVKSEERPRAVTSKVDPTRANGEQPFDFELDQLLKDMP